MADDLATVTKVHGDEVTFGRHRHHRPEDGDESPALSSRSAWWMIAYAITP
jgi:hypothetical protein